MWTACAARRTRTATLGCGCSVMRAAPGCMVPVLAFRGAALQVRCLAPDLPEQGFLHEGFIP